MERTSFTESTEAVATPMSFHADFFEKDNASWRQIMNIRQESNLMADLSAREAAMFQGGASPFSNQADIYSSIFDSPESKSVRLIASKDETLSNYPEQAESNRLLADKSSTDSEKSHLNQAKQHASEGWAALPETTRGTLAKHGYHVEVFRNREEFFEKYHDKKVFEKEGAIGYTSRNYHVIAVFTEPYPGEFTEPRVSAANVVFHEAGHALNNIGGERIVKENPALVQELKARNLDPAAPQLIWFDEAWGKIAAPCLQSCPDTVKELLHRYVTNGATELFPECFALAHGKGSDPEADALLWKYFGPLINHMKSPKYE